MTDSCVKRFKALNPITQCLRQTHGSHIVCDRKYQYEWMNKSFVCFIYWHSVLRVILAELLGVPSRNVFFSLLLSQFDHLDESSFHKIVLFQFNPVLVKWFIGLCYLLWHLLVDFMTKLLWFYILCYWNDCIPSKPEPAQWLDSDILNALKGSYTYKAWMVEHPLSLWTDPLCNLCGGPVHNGELVNSTICLLCEWLYD